VNTLTIVLLIAVVILSIALGVALYILHGVGSIALAFIEGLAGKRDRK
jgi:hypothetical protein